VWCPTQFLKYYRANDALLSRLEKSGWSAVGLRRLLLRGHAGVRAPERGGGIERAVRTDSVKRPCRSRSRPAPGRVPPAGRPALSDRAMARGRRASSSGRPRARSTAPLRTPSSTRRKASIATARHAVQGQSRRLQSQRVKLARPQRECVAALGNCHGVIRPQRPHEDSGRDVLSFSTASYWCHLGALSRSTCRRINS
jgi:hypothetical protein